MYNILRQEAYGVKLQGAISNTIMETNGFGFVDNADLIQGAVKGETLSTLLWKSQKLLTLWEELLRVTDSALDVKDKSDWTLIVFEWNKGIAKLKKMDENHTVKVRDHEEDLVTMKQILPTQARETLGVMQAPSGDETPELEYLEKKLKKWITKIRASPLKQKDVTRALQMTIMRTLRYGLVATAMTYEQCDHLTRTLIQGTLSKMGVVRTANNILVKAPHDYRGMGIIHLDILQMIDHLKIICNHGGTSSDTGKLLTVQLESLAIQTGIGGLPFDLDPKKYSWMEHSWWTNTLTALRRYNVNIRGQVPTLNLWADNDGFIMEDIRSTYNTKHDKTSLRSINRVQLYL